MITREHFLKYLNKGLSVFPVQLSADNNKIQKRPAIEWAQYQNRLATPEEVDVWIAMVDFNAIGMATGKVSNALVIDVDDPTNDYGFTSTVQTRTISGGKHLWYKWQPGIRNTVRVGNKPIDVRGDGGFVVIPPSEFMGKKYEWLRYDFENIPSFPIIPDTPKEPLKTMSSLPEVGEGSRNQTAAQVAGHMVANTKKGSWETTAWPALKNWNAEMVKPPLDERELRTTFDSICRTELVKNTTLEEQGHIQIHYGSEIDTRYEALKKKWGDGLTTGSLLLDEYFTLLPEQLYLISAPTHQGKTTLALNFASKIASFGTNVLFCSLEQGLFIAPRIKTILGGPIPDTFGMLESDASVSTEALIKAVDKMAERPQLVIIDHLHFMRKDTKNGITGAIDQMMVDLQNASKTMQLPMLIIAHLRKLNDERDPQLDDLRDSSSLSQIPSVIIQMILDRDPVKDLPTNTGSLFIRKNRITGKLDKLRYTQDPSGDIKIYPFRKTKEEVEK